MDKILELKSDDIMDEIILKEIRKEIFLSAYHGRSVAAHLASSYSVVEILYVLYCKRILNYNANMPQWEERDRFILSKGHAGLALYVILSRMGFFDKSELKRFCYSDSFLGGEPNMLEIPGVEATTGSLGHGLSYAVGVAIALKIDKSKSKVYVLLGDGECQEGVIWEAVMSAHQWKLDNLIVVVDCNKLQKMNTVFNTIGISDWKSKWKAFGWCVDEIDGHDIEKIEDCFQKKGEAGKPRVILANTIKGYGVTIMENDIQWHYKMPNKRQLKVFIEELGINAEELE